MSFTTTDIVALTLLKHITAAEVIQLVQTCENLTHALETLKGGPDLFSSAETLADIANTSLIQCAAHEVSVVTWRDAVYPGRLHGLHAQPAVLYVRGTLPSSPLPTIGVVGTRTCTLQYGRPVTEKLVRSWCRQGAVIVSGLAAGIDTHAHEACVASRGRTIAVIASGIDRITPKDGRNLAERIVDMHGAIVSEYRCGIAALSPYFPARNRIIAGLSDAIVVVESKRTGGALITASFGEKYNRDVYAVPGPITSTRSEGTNNLIRTRRASALLDANDVMIDLATRYDLANSQWDMQFLKTSEQRTDILGLSPLQKHLVDALQREPMHVDALALRCDKTAQEVLGELLTLELMDVVQQLSGQRYAINTAGFSSPG